MLVLRPSQQIDQVVLSIPQRQSREATVGHSHNTSRSWWSVDSDGCLGMVLRIRFYSCHMPFLIVNNSTSKHNGVFTP